jgi:peroxiredoxin
MQSNIYRLIIMGVLLFGINANAQQNNSHNETKTTKEPDYEAEYQANTLLKAGEMVPDFTLTTLKGKRFQLSELKGKTVFLNFFALTCPICIKELPELEKQIWQKYKDNDNIVILTIGREVPVDKLIEFRNKKGYTFPIASDTDRSVYAMFAEKYIPRNIIIDKEGKLVFTEVGYNEEKFANLIQEIEKQLQKK